MLQPVIIALDFPSKEEVNTFLDSFRDERLFVKVGMELFYQEGPDLIRMLKEEGHAIFLDLKLHDIPTTVYKAMQGLSKLGVDLVNVHAMGGIDMMRRAVEGLEEGAIHQRPKCIAVTQLTSTTSVMINDELSIHGSVEESVNQLAINAERAGLDGVVCSPLEVPQIRKHCRSSFLTVTPGIRFVKDDVNDQKRVTTPGEAHRLGSDFIVVGRSITHASDPFKTYQSITEEWRSTYERTSR
ncbi:orotidine-5'-phosphate decarboxylase [Pseudalkalibacillus sp. SCS-8]|uniref:orotidine-5'-phosphate decarboxylase n=1 Tax=Pseudalkalibacillus nanhaiensis TaxID=3115291 RepID=UPI0032DB96DD